MAWETVVGLEIHVQLQTRSKLFCGCAAEFGDEPNTNVCPVCLGLPGALPVTNLEAVRLGVRACLALGCTVNHHSEFARKNYFYPDLPKGYQISQFDQPLGRGGRVEVEDGDGRLIELGITRLHLEEDAGKSVHDRFDGRTALDFNRAGVPLAEIVTEPDLRSPADARVVLDELKRILQYVEASDCSMEAGRLRVDANLSVRRTGDAQLGIKQEVKNMNSFAAVEHALTDLRELQIGTLESGNEVEQSTYSYATGVLRLMRGKEESHDYRYFPEPDIPVLAVGSEFVREQQRSTPELPADRRRRFMADYRLVAQDTRVLTDSRRVADYYEAVVGAGSDATTAAHWVMGPVMRDANENAGLLRLEPGRLAELIALVQSDTVSNQAAKKVFGRIVETNETALDAARSLGVLQVGDEETIGRWVDVVIQQFPEEFARLRDGETRLIGFFMGEAMKASRGRADPKTLQKQIRERLT